MADATSTGVDWTSLLGTGAQLGTGIYQNVSGTAANDLIQQQLLSAYGNAGNAIQNYSQQGVATLNPYNAAGQSLLPAAQYQAASMSQPYTMQDYQNSPWSQVANSAVQQQTNAMKAKAVGTGGAYSPGTQNAITQNALNTTLGYYGQANSADLQRQGQSMNALSNMVGQGNTAAQSINNNYQNAGTNVAGIAESMGAVNAGHTGYQNALNSGLATSISGLVQGALTKLQSDPSGNSLTPEELQSLQEWNASTGTLPGYDPSASTVTNDAGLNYNVGTDLSGLGIYSVY